MLKCFENYDQDAGRVLVAFVLFMFNAILEIILLHKTWCAEATYLWSSHRIINIQRQLTASLFFRKGKYSSVTFENTSAYAIFTDEKLRSADKIYRISFKFRTLSPSAVLFVVATNATYQSDFVSLELFNGRIRYYISILLIDACSGVKGHVDRRFFQMINVPRLFHPHFWKNQQASGHAQAGWLF